MRCGLRRRALMVTSTVAAMACFGFGSAYAAEPTFQFDIPAEPLGQALSDFSQASSQQIIFSNEVVAGRKTAGLHGRYTSGQALDTLLIGTDLKIEINTNGVLMVRSKNVRAASSDEADSLPKAETVVVTGTRLVGVPPMSPVIEITQQQMLNAGQYTIGDAVRSIPQNFSGGQNPGIGVGASSGTSANGNITGASSINLRGLGPDATLTLLNGHRLSFDSFSQAVDLSVIPVSALSRIEIVPDGASAIYGSDAVAGVANIIMKPDYNGLTGTARLGTSTGGGDFQQQYSVVGGTTWVGGGFIATYDFENDTAINADERSYTSYLLQPYMLFPKQQTHSLFGSGHQDLGSSVTISLDALYHERHTNWVTTTAATSTSNNYRDTTNFVIAPSATVHLPEGWEFDLTGVYGQDQAKISNYTGTPTGPLTTAAQYCWCNKITSIEGTLKGSPFELPAGPVRVAIGAGDRQSNFNNPYYYPANSTSASRGSRNSYYLFGEAYIPLISEKQEFPYVDRLSINVAVRHENYNDFGGVTTPKVGLLFAPLQDLTLESSWGQSFKEPTLYQEYGSSSAYLYKASVLGAIGAPGTATALLAYGGNALLKPEHAATWTETLSFHPSSFPQLHGDISYFQVLYKSRVALPFQSITAALSDPRYAEFVTVNPSVSQQQAAIAASPTGLLNLSGAAYVPGNVIALASDVYTNVAAQRIEGVDFTGSFDFDLLTGSATLTEQASSLTSSQRTTSLSPLFQLAGTIFNPPHVRSRTGLSWVSDNLTLSSFFNYFGGVKDLRTTPNAQGASMTTFDLAAVYRVPEGDDLWSNTELSASVQNLLDKDPPYLRNAAAYQPAFDSSNYSDIGRFVSVSVTKHL